jgi:hypothetical protein
MIVNKKNILSSLFAYLLRPDYFFYFKEKGFFAKAFDILRLWSLGIVVAIFFAYISSLFMESAGLDSTQNLLEDFFNESRVLEIIVLALFWGPISEELTFRLGLRYSPLNFSFFLSFVFLFILEIIYAQIPSLEVYANALVSAFGPLKMLSGVFLFIILTGLVLYLFIRRSKISIKIQHFYENNFIRIFYSFSLLFAFIHFYNYANYDDLWLALPFLIAPQFFIGLLLAYVRMNYGFSWALFFHIFHNALISLPIIFFSQVSESSTELISQSTEGEALAIPIMEKFYYLAGAFSSLIILILLVFLFSSLLWNYRKHKPLP